MFYKTLNAATAGLGGGVLMSETCPSRMDQNRYHQPHTSTSVWRCCARIHSRNSVHKSMCFPSGCSAYVANSQGVSYQVVTCHTEAEADRQTAYYARVCIVSSRCHHDVIGCIDISCWHIAGSSCAMASFSQLVQTCLTNMEAITLQMHRTETICV